MKLDNQIQQLIEEEIKGCFDFFWHESNAIEGEVGYGLTADVAGASGVYEIYSIFAANEFDPVDVKTGWENNDREGYVITEANNTLTLKKNDSALNAAGEEISATWSFVKKTLDVEDGKYTTLIIEFTADAEGQELIFNLNGKEVKPFTKVTSQKVEIVLNKPITEASFQIFVNPNNVGSCTLTITDMYLK